MRKEIKLAGFGGQGIILMGVLLAKAAGYYEDQEIAQTQSYGPEARGGACRAEVVLSDEPIDYTKTLNPDIFIAMSQLALDKYINEVDRETTTIFVDETLVVNVPASIKNLYPIPATKLAQEKCGTKMVANTVMLTAMVKMTKVISLEALQSAIAEQLAPKMRDVNLIAFEIALDYCKERGSNT
jgi:2-oxoglutarate ferredoxin oxidoreductase subunit gamma